MPKMLFILNETFPKTDHNSRLVITLSPYFQSEKQILTTFSETGEPSPATILDTPVNYATNRRYWEALLEKTVYRSSPSTAWKNITVSKLSHAAKALRRSYRFDAALSVMRHKPCALVGSRLGAGIIKGCILWIHPIV